MIRAALILLASTAFAAAADDKPGPLPLAKTLTPPDSAVTGDAVLSADLDSAVYAATRDDLGDLRLFSDDGNEIPYALRSRVRSEPVTIRHWHDVALQGLDVPSPNRIAVTFELPASAPPLRGIRLESPLTDFERQVRVSGQTADDASWEPLGQDALIVDYRRFADVRRVEIPLPENRFRHFRVEVFAVTDEQASALTEFTRTLVGGEVVEEVDRTTYRRRPFRIDRVRWWSETTEQRARAPVRAAYPVTPAEMRVDEETRATVVELQSRREPLVSLTIESPQANFSRSARVLAAEVRAGDTRWRNIGEATLRRIAFRDLQESALTVSFPAHRAEAYRLVIENRDSPPLEVSGVVASGTVHQVLFLAQGAGPYELRYGDPDLAPPRYDDEVVLTPLQAGYVPVPAAVGPERPVAAYRPRPRTLADILNSPAFFVAMVAIAVAVLAWLLFSLGRRIGGTET